MKFVTGHVKHFVFNLQAWLAQIGLYYHLTFNMSSELIRCPFEENIRLRTFN